MQYTHSWMSSVTYTNCQLLISVSNNLLLVRQGYYSITALINCANRTCYRLLQYQLMLCCMQWLCFVSWRTVGTYIIEQLYQKWRYWSSLVFEPHSITALLNFITMYIFYLAYCSGGCHNGGVCIDPEVCECPSNWQGQYCDVGEYWTLVAA